MTPIRSKKRKIKQKRKGAKSRIRPLNGSFLIHEFSKGECKTEVGKVFQKYNTINLGLMSLPSCSGVQNSFDNLKHLNNECLNQTIDLCIDEDDTGTYSAQKEDKFEPSNDPSVTTNLNNDTNDENEVVILKDLNHSPVKCDNNDPTVIDISDDSDIMVVKSNIKKKNNDDIFIINTSNNLNMSHASSLDLNQMFKCYIQKKNKKKNKKKKIKQKLLKHNHQILSVSERRNLNYPLQNFNSNNVCKLSNIGKNIYLNSPVILPKKGLRPIIIDGSNVAISHKGAQFSCKKLEICIKYFKERGHKVTAFVPQFRISSKRSDNPEILHQLVKNGDVILTPSKYVEGRSMTPYDDRFIVQTAVLKGGVIVTRDNYRDLLSENPAWADTINYRTLAYTWVDDVLMFPNDPLGEHGPTLDEFLRFQ